MQTGSAAAGSNPTSYQGCLVLLELVSLNTIRVIRLFVTGCLYWRIGLTALPRAILSSVLCMENLTAADMDHESRIR